MKVSHRGDVSYGEPHIRDYWAGYRMGPENLTPVGKTLWVADNLLPVLAYVDRDACLVGPIGLKGNEGEHRAIRSLATDGRRLRVSWGAGITSLDPDTGERDFRELAVGRVIASDGALWSSKADRLVRIEPDTMTFEEIAPVPTTGQLTVGHGFAWAIVWDPPERSYLIRIDLCNGDWCDPVPVSGSPRQLVATDRGVIARIWRRGGTEHFVDTLVSVAPHGEIQDERVIEPTGVAAAFDEEVVWLSGDDPFAPGRSATATTLRRMESGGEEMSLAVPGIPERLVLGSGCAWARVSDGGKYRLVRADERGAVQVTDIAGLELDDHLPPPPDPIDADEIEQKVLKRLSSSLRGGWIHTDPDTGEQCARPYIEGVKIEDVRLEKSFPDTQVVVTFRADGHPGVLFGRCRPIWEKSGELSGVIDVMDVNLMEDVEACGHGLPKSPRVGNHGIAWF
jgi:hypothetical protein